MSVLVDLPKLQLCLASCYLHTPGRTVSQQPVQPPYWGPPQWSPQPTSPPSQYEAAVGGRAAWEEPHLILLHIPPPETGTHNGQMIQTGLSRDSTPKYPQLTHQLEFLHFPVDTLLSVVYVALTDEHNTTRVFGYSGILPQDHLGIKTTNDTFIYISTSETQFDSATGGLNCKVPLYMSARSTCS